METKIHKFEAAGLGKAPFKFIGMVEQDLLYGQAILNRAEYEKTGVSVTTKPGGTCAYCGTYIVNMFRVRSADGKKFHVGSDCIEKVGDAGLKKALAPVVRAHNKKLRDARNAAKLAAMTAALARPEVRAALAAKPSPSPYRAAKGETLLDHVEWFLANSGVTGKLKVAKRVADVVAALI